MASCKWRGVIRLTRRSLDAFPIYALVSMTVESAKILTSKFQHFGRQVFKNSRRVHSGFGPDTHVVLGSLFKISMNTSNRELDIMG